MTSLWITLAGMGIVFGTILALWGLMAALAGLLADKPGAADSPESAPGSRYGLEKHTPTGSARRSAYSTSEDKAKAAALAVAVALAEQETSTARPLPVPPTALVSAWQLGMRTRQMTQKGERVNRS
ncbi:MAG: hypothetical protein AB1846_01205 [Chloroflexota bacterium]